MHMRELESIVGHARTHTPTHARVHIHAPAPLRWPFTLPLPQTRHPLSSVRCLAAFVRGLSSVGIVGL